MEGTTLVKESKLEISGGFAAVIFFVHKQVLPIARATLGNFAFAEAELFNALKLREGIKDAPTPKTDASIPKAEGGSHRAEGESQKAERASRLAEKEASGEEVYEDEAIAEENYYEYDKADTGGGALQTDCQKTQQDGKSGNQDETAACLEKGAKRCKQKVARESRQATQATQATNQANTHGATQRGTQGVEAEQAFTKSETDFVCDDRAERLQSFEEKPFFNGMKRLVEGIFESYPPLAALNQAMQNARWVKITYGEGKHYAFGVLYSGEVPAYLGYGVVGSKASMPPSLKGFATFVPLDKDMQERGYWVILQDAATGASIPQG
jgi:hypothetical protein